MPNIIFVYNDYDIVISPDKGAMHYDFVKFTID